MNFSGKVSLRVVSLKKYKIMIYLEDDLHQWLEEKASRGYMKSSLIRRVLRRQMEYERRDRTPELGQVAKVEVKQ